MKARVCLIDGTYELFRAYFGAPSRLSPSGIEIGASFALGRSLVALARRAEFTHYAVSFDTVIESFRNRLFAGYKTGEGIEPALLGQFALVEELTAALGFVVLSMREFEADDGIATLAELASRRDDVERVVIASPDKDLMQCVRGKRVVCWDRLREIHYDEEGVREKMGVSPASIPDYLALVGDNADGIPGVPRWGAQSTRAVLAHYGHLEQIPRQAADWTVRVRGAEALTRELREKESEVLLFRTLATLRTDVPLELSWDALEYQGIRTGLFEAWQEKWGALKLPGA